MEKSALSTAWSGGSPHSPDRVAIVDGDRVLSHGELHELVIRAAGALRSGGIEPGARVALVLESSWQYVVCYLAVMRAGAIAVPLNPAARERDLAGWVEHADATFAITDISYAAREALSAALPRSCRLLVCGGAGDPLAKPAAPVADVELPGISPDSPALILFTSGTSGSPKGVLLTHGNLQANVRGIIESLALTADDSIMAVLPFSYAYGNSVLLSHLACGARLVIQRGFGFPKAVVEAMVRERVTGFAGVPSTYALLLSRVRLENFDLSHLRYVTQAGGPMPVALTQRLMVALPGKQIFVMYGQTEATSRLTCLPAHRLAEKPGSVGLPLREVNLQIRDAAGAPCASGVAGDIWASGPNIMAGYWRNPGATAEALRDGWLRTGDVGRLDDEGFLHIVGRRSDIIKVGSHRVHPQDVEQVLAELADVSECAVVGVDDEILGEVIKAFVVRSQDSPLQELQVKRHCLERLAAYKVPKYVEFVAQLPRTSSGKVQRSVLQNPQETS